MSAKKQQEGDQGHAKDDCSPDEKSLKWPAEPSAIEPWVACCSHVSIPSRTEHSWLWQKLDESKTPRSQPNITCGQKST